MFADSKINLIKRINFLQRDKCDYDMFRINKESKPPSFCDCKYGHDDIFKGEQNGCPELRLVHHILSVMTEEEFQEFLKRKQ
jgi:hypothetical protein